MSPGTEAICPAMQPYISLPAWPHIPQILKNDTNICQLLTQEISRSKDFPKTISE